MLVHHSSDSWIGKIPSRDIERVWSANPDRLISTAIADAKGRTPPGVSNLLRSPKWRDRWSDALNGALAELQTAAERMTYEGDIRLPRIRQQVTAFRRTTNEAFTLLKQGDRQMDAENDVGERRLDAEQRAKKILRTHFRKWFEEEMAAAMSRARLPRHHPFAHVRSEDGIDLLERLLESGYLDFPGRAEVRRLEALSDGDFRDVVAEDVSSQTGRNVALRHPLMLNDWMAALQDLQEMTWSALGNEGDPHSVLPEFRIPCPPAREEEVYIALRRRRFYRGVLQRMAEWKRLRRSFVREAVAKEEELKEPWTKAAASISDRIPDVFPREYEAVRRALDPFGETPGSTVLGEGYWRHRKELDEVIHRALRDGTWVNLLKA